MEGQNYEEQGDLHISDVIEVIDAIDPDYGRMNGRMDYDEGVGAPNSAGVFIKILEQPAPKALRFRYECEGRSAGSIPGLNATPENKTYPTIQVVGYQGRAVVVVSCVTKDAPFRPHPHNLVGKDNCKKGVYTVEINNENMIATFANLGIQCVKKKDIEEALRIRKELKVDPFRTTKHSHLNQTNNIDLNSVRLCFQVFLEGEEPGKFTIPVPPVVSMPIYDKKAMADLVIVKLSHCSASVIGGAEIILLCEKVAKEDISVRFYEMKNGQIVWEGYGEFQPAQVHKQVAIAFRTPRYRTLEIDQPVQVNIQLKRPSDDATSDAVPFQLTPLDAGRPFFWSLRRNIAQKGDYNALASILQPPNKNGFAVSKGGDDNNNDGRKVTEADVIVDDQVSVTVADIPQPKVVLVCEDKEDSQDVDDDFEELMVRDLLCEDSKVPDVGNYTSFQLAMKNPCEVVDKDESYEDVIPPPPRPTANKPLIPLKPVSPTHSDDSAPPLPPKRAKKAETPKPEKKLSLFQKLFSTGRRKKEKRVSRRDSLRSLPVGMIEVDSNQVSKKTSADPQNNNEMELDPDKDPLQVNEITEAEHYALYTSVAPHATASEFDEMSFYYSQVEGRKVN